MAVLNTSLAGCSVSRFSSCSRTLGRTLAIQTDDSCLVRLFLLGDAVCSSSDDMIIIDGWVALAVSLALAVPPQQHLIQPVCLLLCATRCGAASATSCQSLWVPCCSHPPGPALQEALPALARPRPAGCVGHSPLTLPFCLLPGMKGLRQHDCHQVPSGGQF